MKVGCPSVTAAQSGKRPLPIVEKGRVREQSKKRKFLGLPERAATGQFLKQNTVTAPKVIKKARGVVRGGLKPPAVSTPSIQRSAPTPARPQRPAPTPHVTAAAVSKPPANSSASVPFHRTTGPSVIPPSTGSHPSVKPIFGGPRHPLSFHVLPRNDALLTIIIKVRVQSGPLIKELRRRDRRPRVSHVHHLTGRCRLRSGACGTSA